MPSVLAEISFVTHRQEGQLLKTPAYRQQIAEALFDAVPEYQQSLKARTHDGDAGVGRRAHREGRVTPGVDADRVRGRRRSRVCSAP